MTNDSKGVPNRKQLERLVSYSDERVASSKHIKVRIEHGEPGCAALYPTPGNAPPGQQRGLRGGVYTTLTDDAMNFSVVLLVSSRTATTQVKVHFLGSVSEGRIPCRGRAPRSRDGDRRREDLRRRGNLVTIGTGSWKIFEKKGNAIV